MKGNRANADEKTLPVNVHLPGGAPVPRCRESQERVRPCPAGGPSSESRFLQSLHPALRGSPHRQRVSETLPTVQRERWTQSKVSPGGTGRHRLTSRLCSPCKPGLFPGPGAPAKAAGTPARPQRMGPASHRGPPLPCVLVVWEALRVLSGFTLLGLSLRLKKYVVTCHSTGFCTEQYQPHPWNLRKPGF